MIKQKTPFEELQISTAGLYNLFEIYPPTKGAVSSKLCEEVGEAINELFESNQHKLAEELADVMVCVLGMAIAGGVSWLELGNAMLAVANKNNAKNLDTHEVQHGTIVKRVNGHGR
jgi:NTP pyrophosphatase (non-canonical NTP hydrolase)